MDEELELKQLLIEWDLHHLYKQFIEQNITITVLKMLKPHHIQKMFNNHTIGDQASFEFHLGKWRKMLENVEQLPAVVVETKKTSKDSEQIQGQVSVMEILSSTSNGKAILKFYEKHGNLYEEQRSLLLNTIIKYIEGHGIDLNLAECSNVEKQICSIFNTEKLEFYTNGKRGKIYNKLANIKRVSRNILKDVVSNEENISEISVDDCTFALQCLRSNNISADDLDLYWRKCASYRFQQIANSKDTNEVFELWPEYGLPSGFHFIDIDFTLKFPLAKELKFRWPQFSEKIFKTLKTKISCASISRELLQIESANEESKTFGILWFLHYLLPPPQQIKTDQKGTKIRKKYSVQDSQEAFAELTETMEELDMKLKLKKLKGCSIQPKLLILGEITDIKSIFVYFDDIKYPVLTILSAFDALFKIFFVFNLKYPFESEVFYNFIQTLLYDLPTYKKFFKVSAIKHEIINLNI